VLTLMMLALMLVPGGLQAQEAVEHVAIVTPASRTNQ
jgi:hypothetical protein